MHAFGIDCALCYVIAFARLDANFWHAPLTQYCCWFAELLECLALLWATFNIREGKSIIYERGKLLVRAPFSCDHYWLLLSPRGNYGELPEGSNKEAQDVSPADTLWVDLAPTFTNFCPPQACTTPLPPTTPHIFVLDRNVLSYARTPYTRTPLTHTHTTHSTSTHEDTASRTQPFGCRLRVEVEDYDLAALRQFLRSFPYAAVLPVQVCNLPVSFEICLLLEESAVSASASPVLFGRILDPFAHPFAAVLFVCCVHLQINLCQSLPISATRHHSSWIWVAADMLY
jgi:hypothetical protein